MGTLSVLSGCVDVLGSNRELGTSVEYRGVKVTPDKYLTANSISVSGGINFNQHVAPQGATYLLTHINSEHIGENKRVFPIRGHSALSTDIDTKYNGEQLRYPMWESYTQFRIDGTELTPYMHAVDPNEFYPGRFEGSASGWIVDVITEGFTRSDTSITITWGESTHTVNAENLQSFTWRYTSDAETTLSELES